MLHRTRALHGLLIAIAIWLPVGQALALCCMTMPHPVTLVTVAADHAQAKGDTAMPCHGQASATHDGSAPAQGGAHSDAGGPGADNCSDGDCHHSCHAGAILRTHILAPAQSLSAESPRVAQPAIHTAHLRRLLRPPIFPR